jgi:predicted RNase H-like HicB family nuclease
MTFLVTLEDGDDGWFVAECPALTGSQGRTVHRAPSNIREAIKLSL